MCKHPRFVRYHLGVLQQAGGRIILYEGTRTNVKGAFQLPDKQRRGRLYIYDGIVRSLINVAGGKQTRIFTDNYLPRAYREEDDP